MLIYQQSTLFDSFLFRSYFASGGGFRNDEILGLFFISSVGLGPRIQLGSFLVVTPKQSKLLRRPILQRRRTRNERQSPCRRSSCCSRIAPRDEQERYGYCPCQLRFGVQRLLPTSIDWLRFGPKSFDGSASFRKQLRSVLGERCLL